MNKVFCYVEQGPRIYRIVQTKFFDATGKSVIASYAFVSGLAYGM